MKLMIKKTNIVLILLLSVILSSCSSVKSFVNQLESVHASGFYVMCTEQVNRNVKGNINDVAYKCNIKINNNTKLLNKDGEKIKVDHFSQGDTIKVVFYKRHNISRDNLVFEAKEIILLEKKM